MPSSIALRFSSIDEAPDWMDLAVEIRGEDVEIKVDVAPMPDFVTRGEARREESKARR